MKYRLALLMLLTLLLTPFPARAATLPIHNAMTFTRADGSRATIQAKTRENEPYEWKKDYALTEAADGAQSRAFPGNPYLLTRLDTGFAGSCDMENGASEIVLYDEYAAPLLHVYFSHPNAFVQSYVHSGDALMLLISQRGSLSNDFTLLCIRDNQLAWARQFDDQYNHFSALHAFGNGSALITGALDEDYTRERILCISAAGEPQWDKTLSAKNAIAASRLAIVNPDGTTTLYGRCISSSRDLYVGFAMVLDAQGCVLSLDARDLRVDGASMNDTEPDFVLSWDDSVMVEMIVTKGYKDTSMTVLFSELPTAASVPAIVLK